MTLNSIASDDRDPVAAQALKLREEAIERLNSGASKNFPMSPETSPAGNQDIVIHPQSAAERILAILILPMALITGQIGMSTDSLLLQIALPILLFLLLLGSFTCLFLRPSEILISEAEQIVSVGFRLGRLMKRNRVCQFAEVKSIQSSLKISGDNDPQVSLELILKNNERFVLKKLIPEWSPSSPLIGFSGCIEPKEIEALRMQIAALTGIENSGFVR